MTAVRADAPAPEPGFEEASVRRAERMFREGWPDGFPAILVDRTGLPADVVEGTFELGGDAEERDRIMEDVRREVAAMEPVGVAVLIEAWVGDEADPRPPSQQPGRREAVVVTVEHRGVGGGATRQWRAPILRPPVGEPTLGRWELVLGVTGRLVGLLPPSRGDA